VTVALKDQSHLTEVVMIVVEVAQERGAAAQTVTQEMIPAMT